MFSALPFLAETVNGHWVNNLNPVLIPIRGEFGIRYYGLAYALAFVIGGWLLHRYAHAGKSRLPAEQIGDFMFWIVVGVMVGGRLGSYFLYNLDDNLRVLRADPLSLLRIWEGGMASHGGMAGVGIATWWYARSRKIPFLHLTDIITSTASAGICLGRMANFINGELWGKVSNAGWAVIFPRSAEVEGMPVELIAPRHPSQLYEAALKGALVFAFIQWRFWRTDFVQRQPGRLAGEYLVAYALARVVGEIFREPDASLLLGLSRGTFYSIFLAATGVALIVRAARSARYEV